MFNMAFVNLLSPPPKIVVIIEPSHRASSKDKSFALALLTRIIRQPEADWRFTNSVLCYEYVKDIWLTI